MDTDRGLVDGSQPPSLGDRMKASAAEAAADVAEFASKVKHEMDEGASKAKEAIKELLHFDEKKPDTEKLQTQASFQSIVLKSPTSPATGGRCCQLFSMRLWDPRGK